MNRTHQLGLIVVAAASMALVTGCTSKITQEQLTQLQGLRQQEATLRQQVASKEQEKSRLQNEVSARRAELDRCNKQKDFVNGKLSQWPDVWTDWKDTPPPPPVESRPRR